MRQSKRKALAVLEFDTGNLILTEAGTKRRASLHLVQGEAALAAMDPGGIDVFSAALRAFAERLTKENHTVKRALTDPHLFSGIGNAYSDEILHRAKMSPFAMTSQLSDEEIRRLHEAAKATLNLWTDKLGARPARASPRKSPRSATRWRCTAATASLARCAARRCSASSTPRTRPTTARAARPAARSWPTARFRACSRRAGRAHWTNWMMNRLLAAEIRQAAAGSATCLPEGSAGASP